MSTRATIDVEDTPWGVSIVLAEGHRVWVAFDDEATASGLEGDDAISAAIGDLIAREP